MAAAARNWGDYIRGELNSINAASRATDLKTLREIVDTLRVVVNRCCAAEKNAEGLEEPPAGAGAGAVGNLAAEQAAEPHEWVRNSDDEYTWFKNSVTGETAWELPPGAILRENMGVPPSPAVSAANENERPPPPPAPAGAPAFATAANRAAARGAVPPPSLPSRAGRLAANMEGCDGVTPEDCRAARLKLRRANSQLAAASAGNAARENNSNILTPPGSPPATPVVAAQSGGNRRKRKTKKNRRGCNYRRSNRRYTER
jgi:hypothetical protein